MTFRILTDWPFLGLVLGIVSTLWLTLNFSSNPYPKSLKWLFWFPLPLYMLHQFEEHGIDLLGRHYAFQESLCNTLGFQKSLSACPATEVFILAVNIGTVWIAGALSGIFGVHAPGVGCAAIGLIIVNALAHISSGIVHFTYNPGLATSILIFLPFSFFSLKSLLRDKIIDSKMCVLGVLSGFVMHAVLMGSVLSFGKGWISELTLTLIQLINGLVPLLLMSISPKTMKNVR